MCALGNEETDLVEEVSALVPPQDQGVQVDHLVPEPLRVGRDPLSESLERVEQRPVTAGRPARDRVQQEADVRRAPLTPCR